MDVRCHLAAAWLILVIALGCSLAVDVENDPLFECEFNGELCGFTQVNPLAPWKYHADGGVQIDVERGRYQNNSGILSPPIDFSGEACLSIAYSSALPFNISLIVEVISSDASAPTQTGYILPSDKMQQFVVALKSPSQLQFHVSGFLTCNDTLLISSVKLDAENCTAGNIMKTNKAVADEVCTLVEEVVTLPTQAFTIGIPTTPTTAPRQTNAAATQVDGSCDFESSSCNYQIPTTGLYKWQRTNTASASTETGPSGDHTSGKGYYAYAKGSGSGTNTIMSSPLLAPVPNLTVKFYYHMYGTQVGTLNVRVEEQDPLVRTVVWTRKGDQGKEWLEGSFNVNASTNYKITFEVLKKTTEKISDVAIDDIFFIFEGAQSITTIQAPVSTAVHTTTTSEVPSTAAKTVATNTQQLVTTATGLPPTNAQVVISTAGNVATTSEALSITTKTAATTTQWLSTTATAFPPPTAHEAISTAGIVATTSEVLSTTTKTAATTTQSLSTTATGFPPPTAQVVISTAGIVATTSQALSTTTKTAATTTKLLFITASGLPSTTAHEAISTAGIMVTTPEALSTTTKTAATITQSLSATATGLPPTIAQVVTSTAGTVATTSEVLSTTTKTAATTTLLLFTSGLPSTTAHAAISTAENVATTSEVLSTTTKTAATTNQSLATTITRLPSTAAHEVISIAGIITTSSEVPTSTAVAPNTRAIVTASTTDPSTTIAAVSTDSGNTITFSALPAITTDTMKTSSSMAGEFASNTLTQATFTTRTSKDNLSTSPDVDSGNSGSQTGNKNEVDLILVLGISGGVLLALIVLIGGLCIYKRRSLRSNTEPLSDTAGTNYGNRSYDIAL